MTDPKPCFEEKKVLSLKAPIFTQKIEKYLHSLCDVQKNVKQSAKIILVNPNFLIDHSIFIAIKDEKFFFTSSNQQAFRNKKEQNYRDKNKMKQTADTS